MPTRNFRELIEAMPQARRQEVEKRFRESVAAMPLEALRKARETTQLQLSEVLGVHQSEVSKIEHRTDICVSTLIEYVLAAIWKFARSSPTMRSASASSRMSTGRRDSLL